jgi:chorismate mutase
MAVAGSSEENKTIYEPARELRILRRASNNEEE